MMKTKNHKLLNNNSLNNIDLINTFRKVTAFIAVTFLVIPFVYSQKQEINNINLYIEQGEYAKAKTVANQLLGMEEYSSIAEVQYYIGKAYYEYVKQDNSEAEADFEKLVLQSNSCFDICMDNDAEGDFTAQCMTRKDGLISVVQNKTLEPYNEKDYAKALGLIKVSLQLNPTPNNYKLAGVCADAINDHEGALEYYNKLVALEKQEINVYKRIIKLSKILKKDVEVQKMYLEKAMKAFPNNTNFIHQQIDLMNESGEVKPLLAMALYQRIIDIDSTDATALFNIAVIYYNSGAISFNNKKEEEAKNSWKKALDYWERAYAVDPEDPDTKTYLNDLYTKLKIDKRID